MLIILAASNGRPSQYTAPGSRNLLPVPRLCLALQPLLSMFRWFGILKELTSCLAPDRGVHSPPASEQPLNPHPAHGRLSCLLLPHTQTATS